ncbi:STAS domain-containing protein [Radiobacillus sp. PE A8.2]|uniref:STAS domain-containing protein n=1 Tax=Radiobacillus sp. PE A8.2 TaxID=3380349 RepID=UPI003890B8BD
MNLNINVVEQENTAVVHLAGEIDAYTAPELKETLLLITKKRIPLIEVDMEQVSYLDSTGLGVIISALKATKEYDGEIKLTNLQSKVMRLFEITSLDSVITIESKVRGGN